MLNLSSSQVGILRIAGEVGDSLGVPPSIVQAVVLVESSAGENTDPGKERSYGVMQITLGAADQVIGRYQQKALPEPTEVSMAQALQEDPIFNMEVGTLYLKWCHEVTKSWDRAIMCYNAGPHAASVAVSPQSNKYVRKVRMAQSALQGQLKL